MPARGITITGWGSALPDQVVDNASIEARLDTTSAWIEERTGIRERRYGGTTASLAADACRAAMDVAGATPDEIDLLILATTSPDHTCPATAPMVQHMLGLRCGAFDVAAACSGFVYSLITADALVAGGIGKALVVGSETLSRITDPNDRNTVILFGDGAGAVVVEPTPDSDVLGWEMGADGSLTSILYAEPGGFLQMEGKEVFRQAVLAIQESAAVAMERAKVGVDDIDLFVPHQANVRIIEAAARRLGIPMDKTALVLERTGNTSAASIPIALAEAASAGRLSPGDLVLLAGFGAGFTRASAVVRWAR